MWPGQGHPRVTKSAMYDWLEASQRRFGETGKVQAMPLKQPPMRQFNETFDRRANSLSLFFWNVWVASVCPVFLGNHFGSVGLWPRSPRNTQPRHPHG
ncbi:hypothetical protein BDV28DRAFT_43035 [Aspergillus coremiiformis]|uniref:Uncharacterized protein n=1 Tax=Aspergillus coremiiformis TaxID=138285 RepID=A0A5N6Z0W4_9EURO|nr:hypothetical protein BDV28DRAFT_43035 [Aspergillus coremiiformis]